MIKIVICLIFLHISPFEFYYITVIDRVSMNTISVKSPYFDFLNSLVT